MPLWMNILQDSNVFCAFLSVVLRFYGTVSKAQIWLDSQKQIDKVLRANENEVFFCRFDEVTTALTTSLNINFPKNWIADIRHKSPRHPNFWPSSCNQVDAAEASCHAKELAAAQEATKIWKKLRQNGWGVARNSVWWMSSMNAWRRSEVKRMPWKMNVPRTDDWSKVGHGFEFRIWEKWIPKLYYHLLPFSVSCFSFTIFFLFGKSRGIIFGETQHARPWPRSRRNKTKIQRRDKIVWVGKPAELKMIYSYMILPNSTDMTHV